MKLRLTPTAARQLARVVDYISVRSPNGARHVQERIQIIMTLLQVHRELGRATATARRRRIIASPYPFAITYRIDKGEIVVLGIRHTARRPSNP